MRLRHKYCKNCTADSSGDEPVTKCRWCGKTYCDTCMKDHLRYHDDANPPGVSRDGLK